MHVPEILKDRKVQIGVAALAVVVLVAMVIAVKRRNKSRPLASVRNINEGRLQNSSLANSTPAASTTQPKEPAPVANGAGLNPIAAVMAATNIGGGLPTQ